MAPCTTSTLIFALAVLTLVPARAQLSFSANLPAGHSGSIYSNRPTQKTSNFLRIGSRQLKGGKYRQALQSSREAFYYCDPVMALNLQAVSEARWEKCYAANQSFANGVDKALSEGRSADTILYNRALLNLEMDDPFTALDCLDQMEYEEVFAGYYYNRALANAGTGRYSAALADWDQALLRDSSQSALWYNRGWTYRKLGQHDEALSDWERALREKGEKAPVRLALAGLYSERGNWKTALQHAEKAYRQHRSDYSYVLTYGQLLQRNGRFRAARKVFAGATRLFPQSGELYCGLADALYHLSEFGQAKRYYDKALRLDPEMAPALIGRGHVQAPFERILEALLDFDLALDYDPGNPYALEGKGIAYFRLRRYEDAVKVFGEALEQHPSHQFSFDAFISQGFAAYRLKRFDEAAAAFQQAIHLRPKHPSGYNGLACVQYETEDFLTAVQNFNLAVRYGPVDDVVLTNRGNALYRIMEFEDAFRDFNRAVSLNPENQHAWNGLGICYQEWERYDQAVEMIERAVHIDPYNKDLYLNLGVSRGFLAGYYHENGKEVLADSTWQAMLADHQQMLGAGEDSSVYFINLGYLHARFDDWDRSMELFRSVTNPNGLKFAENNLGILYALKNQYARSLELFSSAIARDSQMEYAAPRVNRTLIHLGQGSPVQDDPRIIDQISTAEFQKILQKDKYYYTYFYYSLMRYAPPPPELGFHNKVRAFLPPLFGQRGDFLLYPPSVECRKVKTSKVKPLRLKKEKRRGVGKGCPEV